MRRGIAFLTLLGVLTACHGRKAGPAAKLDYAGVKARAEKSFAEVEPGLGTAKKAKPAPAPVPVPETPAPSSRIGEKDAKLNCTWVQAEATVPVGEDVSKSQARATALEKARDAAMRDLLGVEVNQRGLDYQQEGLRGQTNLIESVLRTTRRGCILDEKVVTDEYRDLGPCRQCAYFVNLRACIKERAGDSDKDLHVELSLSRDHFQEGDEANISVTASRDVYLYVYDVGMKSETSLIVPNELFPEIQVKAGQVWTYPDAEAVKRGVHLVAQMPEGNLPVSAETIRVVATKLPLPARYHDPARGGYLGVMQRLNASIYDWAEDAAAFAIYPAKAQ